MTKTIELPKNSGKLGNQHPESLTKATDTRSMTGQRASAGKDDDIPWPEDRPETILTQFGPKTPREKEQCEKTGSREICFSLRSRLDPIPETMTLLGRSPSAIAVRHDDEEQFVLVARWGRPRHASVTVDAMLMRRMLMWPLLRVRVFIALALQPQPLRRDIVAPLAEVDEDGTISLTKDASGGECWNETSTAPFRARCASPESVMRMMQPHAKHVAHHITLLAADAGFDIDPAAFENGENDPRIPTLSEIERELAALQAEGVLGEIDPNGAALLNGAMVFNGNPAVRSAIHTGVHPADGEMFSTNPAHAVDPNPEAPKGYLKSGDRKRVPKKELRRRLAQERRERKAADALNERQAERLLKMQQENKSLIAGRLRDAMETEALKASYDVLKKENAELRAMLAKVALEPEDETNQVSRVVSQ